MIGVRQEWDERAEAMVHRAGYTAFVTMSWLLVAALALRGFAAERLARLPVPLDLLMIAAGGAAAFALVRWRHSAAPRQLAITATLAAAAAALVALLLVGRI